MTLSIMESSLTLVGIAIIMVLGVFVVEMPISLVLLVETMFVAVVALIKKISYSEIQSCMITAVSGVINPILILLLIGGLVPSWIMGGTVPTLIYIGLEVINTKLFLVIAFLMCSLTSMLIGTSWGTMSTLGIAFIGISNGLGIMPAYTVAAIVSGAIVGDKMSPLSSSLVLASELSGATETEGMKKTMKNNLPAFILSIGLYIYLGLTHMPTEAADMSATNALLDALSEEFVIGVLPLLPPVLLIVFMIMKIPSIPTFAISIVIGVLESVFVQGYDLKTVSNVLLTGYNINTNEVIGDMLNYGGFNSMSSMLILLIIAACFGGIIKRLGIITCMLEALFARSHSKGKIITSATIMHTVCFIVTGNYYATNSVLAPALTDVCDKNGLSRSEIASIFLNTGTGISPIVP